MTRSPLSPAFAGTDLVQALRRAAALQRQGHLKEATAVYREVLAKAPNIPEAHHNLGLAYRALGHLGRAEAAFRQALRLKPGYARANHNLAICLARQGRPTEALDQAGKAVRSAPGESTYLRGLAALLPYGRLAADVDATRLILEQCFRDEGIEHQWLVPTALAALGAKPAIAKALTSTRDDRDVTDETLQRLAADPLLILLLPRAIVADETFERLLTALRRHLLRRHMSGNTQAEGDDGLLTFAAALACQCFLGDYAYIESSAETETVEALGQRLAALPDDAPLSWPDLVHLALYRPLAGLGPVASRAAEESLENEALGLLQRRLLRAPLRESRIVSAIPVLALHDNKVSREVKRQYEEHPYPRWLTTRDRPAKPLVEVVSSLFPHVAPLPDPDQPISVLVAGCGSGKHAVDVGTRFSKATVLAIDLSRRSLAYGQRQAEAKGLTNVTFAEADILALDRLEQRFDLVESVGVLHHLADPLLGWRILVGLLKPNGFMRIGLYSRRGREHIEAARAFVASSEYGATSDGIRAARQAIFDLPPDHPARRVTGELDFYSLTGCRDLLFNVQEQCFTLPQIGAALAALELNFLGFELHDPATPAAYAKRFPDDPSMTDLVKWERFEQERPRLFGRMYQFWCRTD